MRGAHSDVWCSKGTPLMEAELFAATGRTPCTVWPRTVMRGELRKGNSGHNSVPKSARRTEPSPRNHRFAAHLRCVSAKEGEGSQEGTGNHTWCPVPFCPPPWVRRLRRETPAIPPPPGGGNATPCHGEHPPARKGQSRLHRLRRCIGGKAYRRQTVKSTKTRRVR